MDTHLATHVLPHKSRLANPANEKPYVASRREASTVHR